MTGPRRSDRVDLESAFRALERQDAGRVPDFGSTLDRARTRRTRRRARVAGIGAGALAIAALWVGLVSNDSFGDSNLADELIASQGIWRAPTDFLLDGRRTPLWKADITFGQSETYTRSPQ